MSHQYRWMKLQKDTKRNPRIRAMPLEQRAVFYDLLQHAGLQTDEGSFDDTDREDLAFEVADAREDVLDATIEHLLRHKVLTRRDDGMLAFTHYDEHQVTSRDMGAERQRRQYARDHADTPSHAHTKPYIDSQHREEPHALSRTLTEPDDKRRGEEDIDIDAAAVVSIPSCADAREAPAPSPDDEPRSNSSSGVCDTLRISASDPAAEVVSAAVHHRGDLDHRYEAIKCRDHYPDWDRKTPKARAGLYAKWVDRAFDPAQQQQQQQNGHQRTRAPTGITETPISHLPPERLAWAEQFNEDAKRRRD